MKNKFLIFDASSLISLSMNGLLPELKKLKENFKGEFIITQEVKKEVVDNPGRTKRYELESLKIKSLLDKGYLSLPEKIGIEDSKISKETKKLINLANSIFKGNGKKLKIIHSGEASAVALSKILRDKNKESLLVIDERTTRVLIEKPSSLKKLLERKLHKTIKLKESNFDYFKGFKIIRSAELMYVAYKKGLVRLKGKKVLEALLYGVKFNGCSISDDEIEEIKKL